MEWTAYIHDLIFTRDCYIIMIGPIGWDTNFRPLVSDGHSSWTLHPERGSQSRIYRRPLGVMGVSSPWNFPMYLANRSIAPALALGNAVVAKAADETRITGGLLLAKIYEEAGLPPGLLNIVVGDVADIGESFAPPLVLAVLCVLATAGRLTLV